jgi:hypothetical protein
VYGPPVLPWQTQRISDGVDRGTDMKTTYEGLRAAGRLLAVGAVASLLVGCAPGGGADPMSPPEAAAAIAQAGGPGTGWTGATEADWASGTVVRTGVRGGDTEIEFVHVDGLPVVAVTGDPGRPASDVQTAWTKDVTPTTLASTCQQLVDWTAKAASTTGASPDHALTVSTCVDRATDPATWEQTLLTVAAACSPLARERYCWSIDLWAGEPYTRETFPAGTGTMVLGHAFTRR